MIVARWLRRVKERGFPKRLFAVVISLRARCDDGTIRSVVGTPLESRRAPGETSRKQEAREEAEAQQRAAQGYNAPMLKRFIPAALGLLLIFGRGQAAPTPADSDTARVPALYTTWDDYYFYVGAQVHDTKVNAVNTSPTSQPQQDDDIEVFMETDDVRASVRTPQTFQMAVSAANGAYFSQGDGSKIPQAKAVYTYKYAANVDGTLNSNSDTDVGYTVEIAIPWQELGRKGPPKPGTVWGFNVISRDRDSTARPAQRLFSLSPDVKSASDVQNPAKWGSIVFESGGAGSTEGGRIVSPRVNLDRFPLINGSIVAGEWSSSSRVAFGTEAVKADAPTVAQEPNTNASPFDNPPPSVTPPAAPVAQAPAPQAVSAPPAPISGTQVGAIDLPGGGSIKVVPGGISAPPLVPQMTAAVPQEAPVGVGGRRVNPLTPKYKYPKGYKPSDPGVDLTGSLTLGAAKAPKLVLAVYRVDYNADGRKGVSQNVWGPNGATLLADQPINGAGPWFSGLRPQWHRQQLSDLRRAGIDVALLRTRADDPLLGRELDALVEALKELKAAGGDYPLVGVEIGSNSASLDTVYAHIPAEFRALTASSPAARAGVLTATPLSNAASPDTLSDGTLVAAPLPEAPYVLSPGRVDSAVVARNNGQTYADAWQKATSASTPYVVIDSWNDFSHGTEVCASRQYGEKYADDTRLFVNTFNGDKQWHAKYLAEDCPRTIRPRTLYQVPVRITNAGTLPWRAREDYSLSPRWYRDGRLYDDSAPRVPIGTDILPGQTVTLSVGLAAQNQYGDDLEAGDYTLVFDMVQGQDRWFSYASDSPLQVPVKVVPYATALAPQATFIGTATPSAMQTGAAYPTQVTVRNDGSANWTGSQIAYKIQKVDVATGTVRTVSESKGEALPTPITAGQAVTVNVAAVPKTPEGQPLPTGEYRLHWFVKPGKGGEAVAGSYDEAVRVVGSDPGAAFVLADIPRSMDAGRDETARLAVENLGPTAWPKGSHKVGYHWYYLDGTEYQWSGGALAPLTKEVAIGRADGDITAKFHAPDAPGRYALAWDVQGPDGAWASTAPAGRADDLLQVIVQVNGKGSVVPIDLRKSADLVGITSGTGGDAGTGFDGQGRTFPAVMLPPDATTEVDGNPLLIGKAGPALYPSGYYAQSVGVDSGSNHRVSFLYPRPDVKNIVVCHGQTIDLPGGNYRAIHLLAASSGGQNITAAFAVPGQNALAPVTVSAWTQAPANATLGLRSPYRQGKNGADAVSVMLGDYVLALDPTHKIGALTLPNNPDIKIVAISLEK